MALGIPSGTKVVVETKWFPPLSVDVTGAGQAPPGLLVRVLRPRVRVLVGSTQLAAVAPGGNPEPNQWPKVKIGLAILVGLAVFGVLRVFK